MKNIKTVILTAFLGTVTMNSTAQTIIAGGGCGKQGYNLIWYFYSDSTLVITGSGDMEDYLNFVGEDYRPWKTYYDKIRKVIVGDSVTSIGSDAFGDYSSITSVIIGKSVTIIGYAAFYQCSNLTSLTIGNSVTTIRYLAFSGCSGLTSLTIPNSVTTIAYRAFSNCTNLTSITVHAVTPPVLINPFLGSPSAPDVFYNVPNTIPVYVPCKSVPAYQSDTNWNYFSNYIGLGFTDPTFIFDTACYKTVYNDNGFNIPAVSGMYYRTETSVYGCDSIICLILAEYPKTPITNYSATICQGDVYNDVHFADLTQAGVYYDTLQNRNGCDSVICLTLAEYPQIPITNYSDTICQGYTFTDNHITNLTLTGIYYDTLQNVNGCDSVIKLTLTVNPTYITPIRDSIYAGNSYNFFGKILTAGGIYYDTLQTINGCDSIIELTLTVTGVGINEWTMDNGQWTIYPNPTNGQLIIDNGQLTIDKVEMYDVVGRKVETWHAASLQGEATSINVSQLANGIYFLRINNKIIKIIKN